MQIDFNPIKDASNVTKHGISLADAEFLNWDKAFIYPDIRKDCGEIRMVGLVPFKKRLHSVVFVEREGVKRIISLRKAQI